MRYNVSSFSLEKVDSLYSATVTITSENGLNGTHFGFLKADISKFLSGSSEISSSSNMTSSSSDAGLNGVLRSHTITSGKLSFEGLLLHSTKRTVLIFQQSMKGATAVCQKRSRRNATSLRVPYAGDVCVRDFEQMDRFSFQFVGSQRPVAQDFDLRLNENSLFRVGPALDVLQSWMKLRRNLRFSPRRFKESLWNRLKGDEFYFSTPMQKELMLRLGTPKKYVRMKKWSTFLLLTVVGCFFTYCLLSLAVKKQSRIRTGISSECVTRTAMLEFLEGEARVEGKTLLDGSGSSLPMALSSGGPDKGDLRLILADKVANR